MGTKPSLASWNRELQLKQVILPGINCRLRPDVCISDVSSEPWSGCKTSEFPAGTDAQLCENFSQMPFYGAYADEQLRGDLRVRETRPGQLGDLQLLCRELAVAGDRAFAHRLAGCEKLAAGPLRKRLSAHLFKQVVSSAQLLSGLDPSVLTS